MKILLAITNTGRKSIGFVSDHIKPLSFDELRKEIEHGFLENIYIVTGTVGTYIRTAPDAYNTNNIDELSVTGLRLLQMLQGNIAFTAPVKNFIELYTEILKGNGPYIEPVDNFRVPSKIVEKVFKSHSSIIKAASKEFSINKFILGAVIIDEIARLTPFETVIDKVGVEILGRGMTVGVAQVSLDTANRLIRKGLYNPNPGDGRLPFVGGLSNENRKVLYEYVVQPEHCIRFAAALIGSFISGWSKTLDISDRPDIVGTLYSRSAVKPEINLEITKRGSQISGEFYQYAKQWLK